MKARFIISAIAAAAVLFSVEANAQVATKKEYKAVEKHEKFLNKEIKEKALKEARKEARKLEKQGYKVPVGQIPLAKQLEDSWQAQYEIDAEGTPYYFIASATTIGSNFTAASMQATNTAKLDIAGQIQTELASVIEQKIANNEISADNAAAVNSFVSASKSVINNTLGRVLEFVKIYRTLENGNIEVMVTLGYNTEVAKEQAVNAMKDSLDSESEDLMKELDKLLAE